MKDSIDVRDRNVTVSFSFIIDNNKTEEEFHKELDF